MPKLHTIADYSQFLLMLGSCMPGLVVSVETWRVEFDAAGISGAKRGGMFRQAANEGLLALHPYPTHAKTTASKGGVRLQYTVTGRAA